MGGTEKSQRKSEYLVSLLLVIITPLFATECPQCLHNDCDSTGLCIKGCKPGFADKYCQYVCPDTCQQSRCEVGDTGAIVCCLGCIDGYQGPGCNLNCSQGYKQCFLSPSNDSIECKSNRYGNHCQHSCEDTCKGFACDDQGVCLSTCTDGRFGANCSLTCRSHQQDSGQCKQSCKPGCPVCTEEDKDLIVQILRSFGFQYKRDKAGTPTFHWEQNMWVVIIVLLAINVVLSILLSTECILRRNCGTTSKGRSDKYKNTDVRDRHQESESEENIGMMDRHQEYKSEDTPGEHERLPNQNDQQQETPTTLQNGETDS